MAVVGDLVNHPRQVGHSRAHTLHGHLLGPGRVLVGHVACGGHGGGGHTLWHCLDCPVEELPTYGPPLASHCTVMNGPAAVRGYP
jgi:hypothetical protein